MLYIESIFELQMLKNEFRLFLQKRNSFLAFVAQIASRASIQTSIEPSTSFTTLEGFVWGLDWCSRIDFWATKAKNEFSFCKEKQNLYFSFCSFYSTKIGSRSSI